MQTSAVPHSLAPLSGYLVRTQHAPTEDGRDYANLHSAGVLPLRFRVRPFSQHQPARARGVEGARWFHEGCDLPDCVHSPAGPETKSFNGEHEPSSILTSFHHKTDIKIFG
jgi:hypothetical protein